MARVRAIVQRWGICSPAIPELDIEGVDFAALKLGYPSITAVQIQSQDGTGEPADVSPLQERAANLC